MKIRAAKKKYCDFLLHGKIHLSDEMDCSLLTIVACSHDIQEIGVENKNKYYYIDILPCK